MPTRHALLIIFLLLPAPCLAQYESQSYLPLTRRETAHRFPVRYLGTAGKGRPGYFEGLEDKRVPERIAVGPSGAHVAVAEGGGIVITGNDRRGAPWRASLGDLASAYASRFYSADLDRDGTSDLIVVSPTGGNGLAPTSHLFALTFDPAGRPSPFDADGYFEEDARGIFDLVDLDRDGRAEFVHMNFDDGYWITTLYEAEAGRWRKVEGRHGVRSYPLYTRFTNRPNSSPTRPRKGRHPYAPDLSTSTPTLSGRLVSYEWADLSRSEDLKLVVAAGDRNVTCSPVSWYGSFGVVKDSPAGREIVTAYGNEDEVKSLLEEAVKSKAAVRLFGRRERGRCSPEWIYLRR